jgi:hypothetical protein
MTTVLDQAKANAPGFNAGQQGKTPKIGKVLATNAIDRTKSDIAEVQKVAKMRTKVVLKAFDQAFQESDDEIADGLRAKLKAEQTRFFGVDLEQELDLLLNPGE